VRLYGSVTRVNCTDLFTCAAYTFSPHVRLAKLQETPPPPLFRRPVRYGTAKRVRYGPETPAAVPYGVSRNGNAVRYGRRRFGAVPRPFGHVSAGFKEKIGITSTQHPNLEVRNSVNFQKNVQVCSDLLRFAYAQVPINQISLLP
jgi:hypothetical protein